MRHRSLFPFLFPFLLLLSFTLAGCPEEVQPDPGAEQVADPLEQADDAQPECQECPACEPCAECPVTCPDVSLTLQQATALLDFAAAHPLLLDGGPNVGRLYWTRMEWPDGKPTYSLRCEGDEQFMTPSYEQPEMCLVHAARILGARAGG